MAIKFTAQAYRDKVKETNGQGMNFNAFGTLLSQINTVNGFKGVGNQQQQGDFASFLMSFNTMNGNPDAIDDVLDESLEFNLKIYDGLHDLLRQPESPESLYQYLLRGAKSIGMVEEFYKGLRDFNEFYGLELNIEELDPEYAAYVKAHPAGEPEKEEIKEEVKEEAPEKKAGKAAKAGKKEKSWDIYDDLHRPEEGRVYTAKEKKTMLSKRFLASYIHSWNLQQNEDRKIAFNLDRARKEAATLTSNWGFKHIAADEDEMNNMLSMNRADLAERTEQLRRPFKNMSFEEKKHAVSELAKFVREKMDPKEGRSSKYKAMVDSILNAEASLDNWDENGGPEENGEKKLEEIFSSTEKYLKGKKSLRSKADQQCRFDQGCDIIAYLGRAGGWGTEQCTKGIFDRVNEVRRGKNQPQIDWDKYGTDADFGAHSNARRLQMIAERKAREQAKKGKTAVKAQKPEKAPEIKVVEKEVPEKKEPKIDTGKYTKFEYKEGDYPRYTDKDTYNTKQKKDELEVLDRPYFVENPKENSDLERWNRYAEEEKFPSMLLSITLGSTLAAINCKLYSNGVGEVGLDKRELEEQQKKYIYFNNPVVEKMAKMLENDPKGRAALFDGDIKLENLNPEKLKEAYDKAAIELAKEDLKKQQAPVLA